MQVKKKKKKIAKTNRLETNSATRCKNRIDKIKAILTEEK